MHDYVNWLRHASPYINAHRDSTFVVMLPGDALEHANFTNIVHDLVLLHSLGVRLVVAFGSRPQIAARLAARGLAPRYHRDLRITDNETLECVIDAVGSLRIALEARLSMDMAASPMQGARLRVASGNFVTARPIGVVEGVDYHHTGEVRRVDRKGIGRLLDERTIVLLSPLGYSPTGRSSTSPARTSPPEPPSPWAPTNWCSTAVPPACWTPKAPWYVSCARNRCRRTSSGWAATTRPNC